MKLNWIPVFSLCCALLVTGCVETVDGRHRAGMPFQKDRTEGRYERTPAELMAAAREVVKRHGTISSDDTVRNTIQGIVDGHNIWIVVEAVDTKVSRILVQARKSGLANIELASFLDKEIAVRLATGRADPSSTPPR